MIWEICRDSVSMGISNIIWGYDRSNNDRIVWPFLRYLILYEDYICIYGDEIGYYYRDIIWGYDQFDNDMIDVIVWGYDRYNCYTMGISNKWPISYDMI